MANEGAQKLREPRIENPFGGFRCKLSGLEDTSKRLYRQQKGYTSTPQPWWPAFLPQRHSAASLEADYVSAVDTLDCCS